MSVGEVMVAEAVSDTRELEVLIEAVEIIDRGLASVQHREIVSADEVADLLLDLRTLVAPLATRPLEDAEVAVTPN